MDKPITTLAEGWAKFVGAYDRHGAVPTEQDRHMFYTGAATALLAAHNTKNPDTIIGELEEFFPEQQQQETQP